MKIIKKLALSSLVLLSSIAIFGEKAEATWSNLDIRSKTTITAEQINKTISTRGSEKAINSNIGEIIIEESEKEGLNAGIIFGMFAVETGYGKSNLFLNSNNVGGLECIRGYACNGRWASFPTVRESFANKVRILKHNYADKGLVTLDQIINVYAPPVENDVNGYVNMIGGVIGITESQPVTIQKVSNEAVKKKEQKESKKIIKKEETSKTELKYNNTKVKKLLSENNIFKVLKAYKNVIDIM